MRNSIQPFGSVWTTILGLLYILPLALSASLPPTEIGISARAPSQFWYQAIQKRGTAAFNPNPAGYKVYRNVRDYGATGNGVTDDTAAINRAIQDGGRCGLGCDSSTTTPGVVYFPGGTYLVTSPIIAMYYSQLVGDPLNVPTIKGAPNFSGMALIDSDPYLPGGANWYQNQNNFFRSVRNFILDTRSQPANTGTGLHWQVAQATSLINLTFQMSTAPGNTQQGIFMDNGSGGFMSDLTFNGGRYGAFFGNQQFLTRNLRFNNCQTAIYMNWNWQWTLKSITIANCGVGLDVTAVGELGQGVGSVVLLDSTITDTPIGVYTIKTSSSIPESGATLVLDNVRLVNVQRAVANPQTGATVLGGGTMTIDLWGQGKSYSTSNTGGNPIQGNMVRAFPKPSSLLTNGGNTFFERSRPQYEQVDVSNFVSVKSQGAAGDGRTDDTARIQSILNSNANTGKIIFFDHGVYLVSNTITVPVNTRIVGESWAVIMADGAAFKNMANPTPVFKVGNPGDVGYVEITELLFETRGPQPGAIMMQWNSRDPAGQQGVNGIWDVHFRIGGSAGTLLEAAQCIKNPGTVVTTPNPACIGAFMLLHIGKTASLYLENIWAWTSDHGLDGPNFTQISLYTGRGIYTESTNGPVWMYATAAEHNVLYQYQFSNTKNVFMAMIQTETPYFQSNPGSTVPFPVNTAWNDPSYAACTTATCRKAWALRITSSSDIVLYGGGLYSFFENYSEGCIPGQTCQDGITSIENSSKISLLNLNTVASNTMVHVNGRPIVPATGHVNAFARSILRFDAL